MTSDAELRLSATPEPPDDSHRDPAGPVAAGWVTVVSADAGRAQAEQPVSLRKLIVQMTIAAATAALLVALVGAAISRRMAESQAVHEVAQTTDILAESVIQPSLTDAMATDSKAAQAVLDPLVRRRVLSNSVVRVKVWSPQGTILYSDEPQLIGHTYTLDSGAQSALSAPQTRAEITNLALAENSFERSQGKLLEVYRPVWTPAGKELLFETYFRYDVVTDRSSELWRGFAGITLSSVALIFLLLVPIMWALLRRARRAQSQREAMIQRALDASQEERQRIAAALHDGIVQELAAASFAVAGGAHAATARGENELAAQLNDAASTLRTSMGGLRSLVVDIYPQSLETAGLPATLRDMAGTIASRGPAFQLILDEAAAAALGPAQQQALFRITQEALRNAVKHAEATEAVIRLAAEGDDVIVEISDNGRGFDPATRRDQHLGLLLISEVAADIGAQLELRTEPGHGTTWRVRVRTR